jgi:hypothetical protein
MTVGHMIMYHHTQTQTTNQARYNKYGSTEFFENVAKLKYFRTKKKNRRNYEQNKFAE